MTEVKVTTQQDRETEAGVPGGLPRPSNPISGRSTGGGPVVSPTRIPRL